ncbi:cyclic nucleotide-binding domain-containing protein 2-like isoform X1 [Mytilus galloprovincialis]|uniref:cyclic nucleotide-binding domain-containing protein 2-like isoform X1 n=1 Tax=Mytilus galloprovincialis TaxID=29158 RepID=UPI003F7B67FD
MEILITAPKPGSSASSKRVQFSRSKTEIDLPSKDEYPRRTKSATRLSSRRSRRLFSEGAVTSTLTDTGSSPRQQMMLRRVLRSRDSRRSNKDDGKFPSPTTDYRRLGSVRSYESSISIARKERDAKLRFKLKLWTHALVYFQKLHKKIIRNNQELEAFKKQMDFTEGNFVSSEDSTSTIHMGLDVDRFKPVTQIRMSKEAKRILLKDPELRTPEEIKHVRTDLMVTKTESIQTLPEDCQLRLAKNVGLESLGAKRFIIKEGYTAEYCYLIIVGSVIRAWLDEGAIRATSDDKSLKEGQMFGESEMKSSSPRKASYISASYTEILQVSAEDYHDIFLAGEKVGKDDVLLLKQIEVFNGWDLENIAGNSEKIKRKYFPNNWMVKENESEYNDPGIRNKALDSRQFEWIYIVKTGSITVMTILDKIKPTINQTTGNYSEEAHTGDGYLAFLTKGAEYDRFSAYNSTKCLSRPLSANNSYTTNFDVKSAPLLHRLHHLLRPKSTENGERFISTPDSLKGKHIPTSAISSKLVSIPKKRRQSCHRRDQSTPTPTPEIHRDDSSLAEDRIDSSIRDPFDSRFEKTSSNLTDDERRLSSSRKKHVTIEPRDFGHKDTEDGTVICKIKTLTKGDVFGLEYIVFDEMDEKNQPGFILKSNGSECLMIHKKVYKDITKNDFDLKEKLRSVVSPFPEEDNLKENLLIRTNWELHKDILLDNIMSEKARLKPQKHGQKFASIRLK